MFQEELQQNSKKREESARERKNQYFFEKKKEIKKKIKTKLNKINTSYYKSVPGLTSLTDHIILP